MPTLGGTGERGETSETAEQSGMFINDILIGLTGLADRTRRHIEWLVAGEMQQGGTDLLMSAESSFATVQWIALLHVRTRDGNQP